MIKIDIFAKYVYNIYGGLSKKKKGFSRNFRECFILFQGWIWVKRFTDSLSRLPKNCKYCIGFNLSFFLKKVGSAKIIKLLF